MTAPLRYPGVDFVERDGTVRRHYWRSLDAEGVPLLAPWHWNPPVAPRTRFDKFPLAAQSAPNFVVTMIEQHRYREAFANFVTWRRTLHPQTPFPLRLPGWLLLAIGDYRAGWWANELRTLEHPVFTEFGPGVELWDGRPTDDAVTILPDFDYGDILQACRFLPRVADRVGELRATIQPRLLPLLQRSFPDVIFHPETERVVERFANWDSAPRYYFPPTSIVSTPKAGWMMSLPYYAGLRDHADLWNGAPYLVPPEDGPRLPDAAGRLKVGINWRGEQRGLIDSRHFSPAELAPLFTMPDVAWYGMQFGDACAEGDAYGIRNCSALHSNFDESAALMVQLDAFVTCDTSAAHLAGGLGVPTILILPKHDWRWLTENGGRSVWYPNTEVVRLTSCDHDADWTTVVETIRAKLARLRENGRPSRYDRVSDTIGMSLIGG